MWIEEVGIPREISNEQAVTFVAAAAGLGGFIGQVIAAGRLADREGDTIPIEQILLPSAVGGLTAIGSAFLIPKSGGLQPSGIEEAKQRREIRFT